MLPHRAELKKHAARVVGVDEADDLVQNAFARLLSYADWREIANARAFCLTIVRNRALERLHRASVVRLDAIAFAEVARSWGEFHRLRPAAVRRR